jgi:hypothetical protein
VCKDIMLEKGRTFLQTIGDKIEVSREGTKIQAK